MVSSYPLSQWQIAHRHTGIGIYQIAAGNPGQAAAPVNPGPMPPLELDPGDNNDNGDDPLTLDRPPIHVVWAPRPKRGSPGRGDYCLPDKIGISAGDYDIVYVSHYNMISLLYRR
jgi:hypothetical protein